MLYYINCDQHVQRRRAMERQLRAQGLVGERVECITRGDVINRKTRRELAMGGITGYIDGLRITELAITLSHIAAYNRIARGTSEYGVIVEDDAILLPDFAENVMRIVEWCDRHYDESTPLLVYLWNGNWAMTKSKRRYVGRTRTVEDEPLKIYRETVEHNAGAVAVLVSRSFAREFVQNVVINLPIDNILGSFPVRGAEMLTLEMFRGDHDCLHSLLVYSDCHGEGGTGDTTQDYDEPVIGEIDL
jgi:GR25 family glycosyltransferase involved in LPS biosynthesis